MQLNHFRTGAGEPLVLIHGIGSRWQVWNPVIGRLAAEREVIALDLPGFAASPPPPAGTEAGIDSLATLVSGFLAEQGLERPHVAGNSLGGWLSLELARRGQARSATALSPAGFAAGWESVYARKLLQALVRLSRAIAPSAERVLAPPALRRVGFGAVIRHPERMSVTEAAETARALGGASWFDETLHVLTRRQFNGGPQIEVPVTIAWGEHDWVLLRRQAARAHRAVPAARMVTLTGCGHVPTYDDPEQVARVLLEGSSS